MLVLYLKENRYSVSYLSNKQYNGGCKNYKPQNPESKDGFPS